MSAPFVVAVAQPPARPRDLAEAVAAHVDAVRRAGATLVVFPELSLTGYRLDAAAVALDDAALAPLVEACRATGAVALAGAPVVVGGARLLAVLRIDADGAALAYAKVCLGEEEARHFTHGREPGLVEVAGRRVGVAVCRDTGQQAHMDAVAAAGVDLLVAGLVHRPDELVVQDARGPALAIRHGVPVAFASCAGPTGVSGADGGAYDHTAGHSTIWAADGTVLARADRSPGAVVSAPPG